MIGSKSCFADAFEDTRRNKDRVYSSKGTGGSGFERVSLDIPDLRFKPKFALSRDDRVFTIGSCFARNVESAFSSKGLECITSKFQFSGDLYELTGLGARNGALNAYTPATMLDLIRLPDHPRKDLVGALQVGEDEWIDMLLSGLRVLTYQELCAARENLLACYSALPTATLVVLTLGYTESWFDREHGIYVNRSPGGSPRIVRRGERYDFHNLNHAQVTDYLRKIVSEIRQRTNGARILVTTSPVPLHATFTNMDVVIANQYSKSTLMSSAVQVASEHGFVDYFPSYEIVTNASKELAWESDGTHVKPSLVAKIMSKCLETYVAA